jgi:hypothetical protein
VAWQELGAVAPKELAGARVQAHWAAQVISAAGETFVAHEEDTSHTAMEWDAGLEALAGRALPGPERLRVALRVRELELLLVDASARPLASQPLAGRTLAEAHAWASGAVRAATRGRLGRALVHPGYELPPHALSSRGRFEVDAAALAELARWYANADGELRELAARTPGAGPVRCWPHHFDLATLVAVETGPDGSATKAIGVGLAPGDEFVAEPYWYVNHAPEAEDERLPPLAAGEWWTSCWTGAILRGEELVAAGGAAAQQARLRTYLASAVEASRRLLEGVTSPSP